MVDDRLDVHVALRGVVPHLYLFGPRSAEPPGWVWPAVTWAQLEWQIAASCSAGE
jgi:hypothetical protein